MAKRSQRRAVRYEKDQSGCMWGFISIFDFRHGRSTRKLITDRRHGSKHAIGTGITKNKFELLGNLEEHCQGTNADGERRTAATLTSDTVKPSVKKLIEEEMVNEQGLKKETRDTAVEPKYSDSAYEGDVRTDHKRIKKTRKKSRDMDTQNLNVAQNVQSECSCKHNAYQQPMKDLAIDEIMEEFSRRIHQKSVSCTKDGLNGEAPELSTDRHSDFEEKLNGVIKEFIIQKFTDGKHLKEDQKIHLQFRELMDKLQLTSSDEELFMKLLQDPQSLLVKYVQSLQDSQVEKDAECKPIGGSDFSEQKLVNSTKSEDVVNNKHRSFFRRKTKSQERNQLEENEHPDILSKIVILKPGPTGLRNSKDESSLGQSKEYHDIVRSKEPSDRIGSHFFLSEIKRKFKHAMRKQQEIPGTGISSSSSTAHQSKGNSEKGVGKGNVGRNSPTKDHFYIERIAKPSSGPRKVDKVNKMSEISKHETDAFPSERMSSIYVEAKKHLSELLSNGDGADLSNRQNPKTLGRILSLPEYSVSPNGSPRKDWENSFVTAQMRFSSQDKYQMINENRCSSKPENNVSPLGREAENLESNSPVAGSSLDHKVVSPNSNTGMSDDIAHEIEVEEAVISIKENISCEEFVKEISITSDGPCEPCSSSTARDNQSGDVPVTCDSLCLKLDLHEEIQPQSSPPGSPSRSFASRKVADSESSIDIPERPSPVSVLEPLFGEDDISPANSISQPVNSTIQPLRIEFEDPGSPPAADEARSGKRLLEDKESICAYAKALMQASGLDWDEICIKLLSSDQLLEPSLVDEVEFFSNKLCCDQKLLFDCMNEVLVEVCQYYFGSSPWLSFVKPSVCPIPDMTNVILVVSKGVYWHLLQLPLPHSLDQIIRKDMARTGTWLDTRFDAETIGFDLGETILEDLVEDTIFSCVNES
ncbi:uncharacterized protein LOC133796717 isoform X2 [Humulus lupulus]|uniref:uncharacterized protein LOC133796717 isoform X2 n=1 Tax=Humulus lupulus TaxID=3486 RepID=UPI002B40421D|nr:uncharacterized protein LOC133796717 isoform X2 [Humulus lupulus]